MLNNSLRQILMGNALTGIILIEEMSKPVFLNIEIKDLASVVGFLSDHSSGHQVFIFNFL